MKKIPLSGRNGAGLFALVDDEDYLNVGRFKWHATKGKSNHTFYACRYVSRTKSQKFSKEGKDLKVYMHRSIMRARRGEQIDHKNRDGLDNRRSNLRFCDFSQNGANRVMLRGNSSGYRGVHRETGRSTWKMYIGDNPVVTKRFACKIEAARAYDAEAKKRWGEFARLNFSETVQ